MHNPLSASPPKPNHPTTERRRSTRFPSDLQTECRSLISLDRTGWHARVLNVSCTGLALVLSRRFEKGTVLTMDLEDALRGARHTILARVVHTRPHQQGGTWLLGCVFVKPLNDEELRAFCVKRLPAKDSDPRAWVRFACDVATFCRRESDVAEPVPVRVVNIAPGGVGLIAAEAWESGSFLQLALPETPGSSGGSVLLRVVRSEPAGADWFLGCEFGGQFSEEDLKGLVCMSGDDAVAAAARMPHY
jgi:hypothetical protein